MRRHVKQIGRGRINSEDDFLDMSEQERMQMRILNEMGLRGDNLDNMTYEQLLNLEEKIGSVSKGLRESQIIVLTYNNIENT